MAQITFSVPRWLEGASHLPTTLPGLALFLAPHVLDFFYPGSASLASKIIADLGGAGLILATGDTKPPPAQPPAG